MIYNLCKLLTYLFFYTYAVYYLHFANSSIIQHKIENFSSW